MLAHAPAAPVLLLVSDVEPAFDVAPPWRIHHTTPEKARQDADAVHPAVVAVTANGDGIPVQVPLIAAEHVLLTDEATFAVHLEASRAGFAAVLRTADLDGYLTDAAGRLGGDAIEEPYRVLSVGLDDASARVCRAYADIAGQQWIMLHHVTGVMAVLETMAPDVIVMADGLGEVRSREFIRLLRRRPGGRRIPFLIVGRSVTHGHPLPPNTTWLPAPLEHSVLAMAVQEAGSYARQLGDLMDRDWLTGLLNRRSLQARLATEISRADRVGGRLSLAMIDLDHFKRVNDTYGHLAGDRVLRRLGEMLGARLRVLDAAARFGGEEVAIILPETRIEDAARLIDALREEFAAIWFPVDGMNGEIDTISVTFSAGVAACGPMATPARLIADADEGLYLAKSRGRNRVERVDFETDGSS